VPIPLSDLQQASGRYVANLAKSLTESLSGVQKQNAFLCHSHLDAEYVQGLITILGESGWKIYVDWPRGAREIRKPVQS
jgi:hypothetical protein